MRRVGSYEAKTNLSRLLDEVSRGETVTITKHGIAVAVLAPPAGSDPAGVREAINGLRAFRSTHGLRGVTIRELIEEGRR